MMGVENEQEIGEKLIRAYLRLAYCGCQITGKRIFCSSRCCFISAPTNEKETFLLLETSQYRLMSENQDLRLGFSFVQFSTLFEVPSTAVAGETIISVGMCLTECWFESS
jgi:hypothetical protein